MDDKLADLRARLEIEPTLAPNDRRVQLLIADILLLLVEVQVKSSVYR